MSQIYSLQGILVVLSFDSSLCCTYVMVAAVAVAVAIALWQLQLPLCNRSLH